MKNPKRHLYKLQAFKDGGWKDIVLDESPLRFYTKDKAIETELWFVRQFRAETRIVPTSYLVETIRSAPGYIDRAPTFCPTFEKS